MVVDDDEISRDILAEFLAGMHIEDVHLAKDGRDALRTLATLPRPVDYVIVDVFMPNMDGIEFLIALAQLQFKGWIVLASSMNIEVLAIARQVAIDSNLNLLATLTKPINPNSLRAAFDVAM